MIKKSEEVRVKLVSSEQNENRYWNLREATNTQSNRKDIEHFRNHSKEPEGQINIQFTLDETRKISEEQKKTILNTLITEEDDNIVEEQQKANYGSFIPDKGLIPLIALLAFLAFFILIATIIIAGGPHYY